MSSPFRINVYSNLCVFCKGILINCGCKFVLAKNRKKIVSEIGWSLDLAFIKFNTISFFCIFRIVHLLFRNNDQDNVNIEPMEVIYFK